MLSTEVMHERVAAPSKWTVQAPHSAMPQPNLVPVMPRTSRSTQSSGVSPSTSTLCVVPLTLRSKAMASSPFSSVATGGAIGRALPEREGVGAGARPEELHLEGPVGDRPGLPDELVEARLLHAPPPLRVDVEAVVGPGRGAVDRDAEADGAALGGGRQDEVEVARVEPVADAAGHVVQRGELAADRPDARQAPPVERQRRDGAVERGNILEDTARRREILGPLVADVVLRRLQARPIGGRLDAAGVDRRRSVGGATRPGLGQQLLDDHLRPVVRALAELVVPDASLRVDEVEGGPILVPEGS